MEMALCTFPEHISSSMGGGLKTRIALVRARDEFAGLRGPFAERFGESPLESITTWRERFVRNYRRMGWTSARGHP